MLTRLCLKQLVQKIFKLFRYGVRDEFILRVHNGGDTLNLENDCVRTVTCTTKLFYNEPITCLILLNNNLTLKMK